MSLPTEVETGSLFRIKTDRTNPNGGIIGLKLHAGAYLRVANGHRSITVGCPHPTGLHKHWAGQASDRRRKWWEIDLSAPAFVELQYALAEAGALELPPQEL